MHYKIDYVCDMEISRFRQISKELTNYYKEKPVESTNDVI